MAHLFISYAREDRRHAERLARALQRQGLHVWWDLESLRSGQSFSRAIQQALEGARCVVVLWSRASVASRWVESEAYWAWEHQKLHSVRLDDTVRLPVPFNTLHARSLATWDGRDDFAELRRLVDDIRLFTGLGPAPSPPIPAASPRTGSERGEVGSGAPAPGSQADLAPRRTRPPSRRDGGTSPAVESKESAEVVQEPVPPERPHSGPETQARPSSRGTAGTGNRRATPSKTKGQLPPWAKTLLLAAGVGGVLGILSLVVPHLRQETATPPSTAEPKAPGRDEVVKLPEDREGEVPAEKPQATSPELELPEMVTIPVGTFRMGCVSGKGCSKGELPVRTVTFDRPFAIGKYEVTFDQYDAFAEATNRELPGDQGWGRGRRPVIYVSWEDAAAYAQWLSEQTGKRYRLPSEAEWEYATRAGTSTRWSFGDDEQALGEYAWYSENAGSKTHPVGEKSPNPWGLHDVHGNVWEWVQDCWNENYEGAPMDGSAWQEDGGGNCGRRVVRGGSWFTNPEDLRSASRYRIPRRRPEPQHRFPSCPGPLALCPLSSYPLRGSMGQSPLVATVGSRRISDDRTAVIGFRGAGDLRGKAQEPSTHL